MCRNAALTLPPTAIAAREGRTFATDQLAEWELLVAADTVRLLTSELVTNAARHARTDIELTLAVAEGSIEVGVADHEPRPPRPRHRRGTPLPPIETPNWVSEAGRGLLIVDVLADEWGVEERRNGKQVWFRLDTHPGWPYLTQCGCAGGIPAEARRLGSGRQVVALPPPWR
ncbi:MAG TPA: ATP-binding protein [Mycobacteriales bacterium]|nr:ATP-binding protein [Mycobacteriales bacterium]